jgi:hypothetical protein
VAECVVHALEVVDVQDHQPGLRPRAQRSPAEDVHVLVARTHVALAARFAKTLMPSAI